LLLSEFLQVRFKNNFVLALKMCISVVEMLDKSVTNFFGLMENLALKIVQALHKVDKIESVKGGILLASQILKSCRSLTTFKPAFEKLS